MIGSEVSTTGCGVYVDQGAPTVTFTFMVTEDQV